MKKITTTQKINLGAVLTLAVCVTGYVFFFKHIQVLHTELGELNSELRVAEQMIENRQATVALLDSTRAGREELSKYFVPVEDPTLFLDLLDTVAEEVGVDSHSENIEIVPEEILNEDVPEEYQQRATAVLVVEGGWNEIHHYISLLELFPYLVTVDNVALTIDKDAEVGEWTGQITLHSNAM